tara:strand:+ start:776 stop:1225 length:450 start_codon:yes stop_codon:yes gene_type:complete
MARRKTKRRRSRRSFSILNALEALAYATILTEGVAGTSPWGFITGNADLKGQFEGQFLAMTSGIPGGTNGNGTTEVSGAGEISLGDLATNPGTALTAMGMNFQNNLLPMAIAGFTTAVGFKVGKRLLRKPISSVNRNIIKPALGAGIRL